MKKLCAPADQGNPELEKALTAGSPGGTELLSPCWEQGEPVLYVLALTYVHADSRRLEATMPCQRGNKEGKRLQELKNEGRQGGWIQGMERRVLGKSGCTMVLFLDQRQGFVILND